MPTESFEVSDPQAQLTPDPTAAEVPPVAEPTAEAVEETVPYRHGDAEIDLPISALQTIAERLGYDNPAAIVNQLRNGADAQETMKWARNMLRQRQSAPQYQPPPAPPQPPVDQRWNQHLERERQDTTEPDYGRILMEMNQRQNAILGFIQQDQQRREWEQNQKVSRIERDIDREYSKFADGLLAKGMREWQVPSRDFMVAEADAMGMLSAVAHGELQPADMFNRLYRMLNADSMAQAAGTQAVKDHVEKLRDPRARVTVPPARPAPATAQTQAQIIDNMKLSDILPIGERI